MIYHCASCSKRRANVIAFFYCEVWRSSKRLGTGKHFLNQTCRYTHYYFEVWVAEQNKFYTKGHVIVAFVQHHDQEGTRDRHVENPLQLLWPSRSQNNKCVARSRGHVHGTHNFFALCKMARWRWPEQAKAARHMTERRCPSETSARALPQRAPYYKSR